MPTASPVFDLTGNFNLNTAQFAADLQRMGRSIDGFATKAGTAMARAEKAASNFNQRVQKNAAAIQSAGVGLASFGAAVSAAFGVGVKVAGDFQGAMNRVAAHSGAAGAEFEKLQSKARDLGRNTQYSATQVADAMVELSKAGLSTEQVLDSIGGTLQLASAGQLGLAEAAKTTSNTLAQFGLDATQASKVNDVLAAASGAAATDIGELSQAFSYAGNFANTFGLGVAETGTALTIFAKNAITGSRAGTGLTGVLRGLVNNEDKLRDLGVSVRDASGEFADLHAIFGQLKRAGLSEAELIKLFGTEALPGAIALLNSTGEAWTDLGGRIENSAGRAAGLAKQLNSGLSGSLKGFRSAAEGLGEAVGRHLLPKLESMIRAVSGIINKVTDWVDANPRLASALAIAGGALGALATAAGGFLLVLPQIASGIALVTKAFAGLSLAGGPLGLAIAGIAALVAIGLPRWLADSREQAELLSDKLDKTSKEIKEGAKVNSKALDDTNKKIKEQEKHLESLREQLAAKERQFGKNRFAYQGLRREIDKTETALSRNRHQAALLTTQLDIQAKETAAAEKESRKLATAQKVAASAAAASAAMQDKVNTSLEKFRGITQIMADAFNDLKVDSVQSLQSLAREAKSNFELIRDSGKASAETVWAAYERYMAAAGRAAEAAKTRVQGAADFIEVQRKRISEALASIGSPSIGPIDPNLTNDAVLATVPLQVEIPPEFNQKLEVAREKFVTWGKNVRSVVDGVSAGLVESLFTGEFSFGEHLRTGLANLLGQFREYLVDKLAGVFKAMRDNGVLSFDGLKSAASSVFSTIGKGFSKLGGWIKDAIVGVGKLIARFLGLRKAGGAVGAATGGLSVPSVGGGGGTSTTNPVPSGGGGIGGILNIVTGIGNLVSGIIGNFQQRKTNDRLLQIADNTYALNLWGQNNAQVTTAIHADRLAHWSILTGHAAKLDSLSSEVGTIINGFNDKLMTWKIPQFDRVIQVAQDESQAIIGQLVMSQQIAQAESQRLVDSASIAWDQREVHHNQLGQGIVAMINAVNNQTSTLSSAINSIDVRPVVNVSVPSSSRSRYEPSRSSQISREIGESLV